MSPSTALPVVLSERVSKMLEDALSLHDHVVESNLLDRFEQGEEALELIGPDAVSETGLAAVRRVLLDVAGRIEGATKGCPVGGGIIDLTGVRGRTHRDRVEAALRRDGYLT